MANLYATYRYFMDELADPRVKNWPLMDNPGPGLSILATYLYFVLKIGPSYMENKKPFNLKTIIQVYNIFQVIACILLIYGTVTNGWLTTIPLLGCGPIDFSNDPMAVRLAEMVWWTSMLKFVELIETIFFVLRKKSSQISTLHLYHHVSTALIGWLGAKFVPGGMATFPLIINSFIHVLMYSYYFLSTLGPTWQKKLGPWKQKLTILQMIQFCIVIAHASMALQKDCSVPNELVYIFIPDVLIVFYLFYDFYKKTYTTETKKVK